MENFHTCAFIFVIAVILQGHHCESAYERQHSPTEIILLNFENPAAIIQDGTEGSTYFGASIALYRSNELGGAGWIFIGAPRANEAFFLKDSRPGRIWRCNLNSPTCSALGPISHSLREVRFGKRTVCEGMFLGGSMVTSKEDLIACAPRWGRVVDHYSNKNIEGRTGACYRIKLSDIVKGKMGTGREKRFLAPFATDNFITSYTWVDDEGLMRFDQGQVGFSAHVSKMGGELVTGAVGSFYFDGAVVLPLVRSHWRDPTTWHMFSFERINTWQYFSSVDTVCDQATNGYFQRRVLNSGYLGYAVTSGQYFDQGEELIAASAPISAGGRPCGELLGSVLVIISGGAFGSYFGAAMESVDINADGLDDLIVGAPLECGSKAGTATDGQDCIDDAGCIYIYSNHWEMVPSGGSFWKHAHRICSKVPWGRFGSSIARLGDIDQDGFNDFAVGAPYEEKVGAVYVYFGRGNNGNFEGLRISGEFQSDFGITVAAGFGQSIIGDVDLDGNGTPDFAVGNHLSQTVAIFRTRPVLNVKVFMSYFRTGMKTTILKQTDTEFLIQYCLNITFAPSGLQRRTTITIWNELTVDEVHQRFQLEQATSFPLTFSSAQHEQCIDLNANATSAEKLADAEDFPDLTFSATVSYNGTNGSVFNTPSMSNPGGEPSVRIFQGSPADFCTDCPYSMQQSFRDVASLTFATDCMKRGDNLVLPVCKPVLIIKMNHSWHPYDGQVVLGNVSNLVVKIRVRNVNQTAFGPIVRLLWRFVPPSDSHQTLTPPPTVAGTPKLERTCPNDMKSNPEWFDGESCQLVRPVLRNQTQETLTFELRMGNVVALRRSKLPTKLELRAEVHLEKDTEFKPVGLNLSLNLIADANVTLMSSPVMEQLPLMSPSVKKSLEAKFQVDLGGESPVRVQLFVGLPTLVQISPRAGELFQIGIPQGWECTLLEISKGNLPGIRALDMLAQNVSAGSSTTNCLPPSRSSGCKYYECEQNMTLDKGERRAHVIFRLGMSNDSEKLLGNLMGSEGFRILGFAYAYIFDDRAGLVNTDNSACVFDMKLLPPDQKEIEAWIIIAAAASALLFLSCVIFGLCKCGFFKREKKEQLLAAEQRAGEADESEGYALDGASNGGNSSGGETEEDVL